MPDFDHASLVILLGDRNVRPGRQLVVTPVPRTRPVGVRKVMSLDAETKNAFIVFDV